MKKTKSKLEIVNPDAAGIDIGSAVHYVCVPEEEMNNVFKNLGALQ